MRGGRAGSAVECTFSPPLPLVFFFPLLLSSVEEKVTEGPYYDQLCLPCP